MIQVNDEIENFKVGQNLGLEVVGWCDLHTKAYNIYHKMESERFGFVTSKIYKENRKEFNKMYKEAERLVKLES